MDNISVNKLIKMKYKNLWQNFLNAHQLTKEQLEDKEYIDSLYENFLENVEQLKN